ncbi:hypothetical protein VSWAT3_21905 [Vibrionales bacterium SWAT-3]|nr:hypothetical protein VSWAT3_21905 [Vibrionales bacterium SWAT-3]
MSKVMVMSAVMLALSNNASASLLEAAQSTISLRTQCVSSHAATSIFLNSVEATISQINKEIMTWRETYREIDESSSPELYFDDVNTAKLLDADTFVRASEEMLRIQVTDLFADNATQLPDDIIAGLRRLRVTVAKLRMAIGNVLSIEVQLRPAKPTDEAKVSNEFLTALKTATSNTYYH